MKNLNIATWDMKGFRWDEVFFQKEIKTMAVVEFLENEKIDVLAMQNLDRGVALSINDILPAIGYHFDHLNVNNYTLFDSLIEKENNLVIVRDNFLNVSVPFKNINKVIITDENNLSDKFCIINTSFGKNNIDKNLDRLSNIVNYAEYGNENSKMPIILTGRIDASLLSDSMLKFEDNTLIPNDIKPIGSIKRGEKYNYIMLNDFDVEDCASYNTYAVSDMSKPLMVKVKMK